ncbi:MAG: DUF5722 domain-containing protein [Oscillospiraceae bacterium]|nr:DUF5722 domain-containing protein [Oscillospiraceae bacterium]
MKIISIKATGDNIIVKTDQKTNASLKVMSPALREEKIYAVYEFKNENCITLPRCINGKDGLYLKYLPDGEGAGEGIKYVNEYDFTSENEYDYPAAATKKGLQVAMVNDAVELGIGHAALNINIGNCLLPHKTEDCITYLHEGREYYISKKEISAQDARIKELSDHGIIITMILLNAKSWAGADFPAEMRNVLMHPDYDDEGTISAFNVMTEAGTEAFCAWLEFIAGRYTREDQKYGRIAGFIVSNEINSQWVWGNAGEKTCGDYMYEYTSALRMAYLAGIKMYKNMRTYISLDHWWTGAHDETSPMRFYGSRFCLEYLNKYCAAEGDFWWNIAFHPYPENLFFPDFWNDVTAQFNDDTKRVTFKNLEVLRDFLYEKQNMYGDIRRRVILSEQGFNSHFTPHSEILQACAYGRAYRAVMEIPEIDSFILHAHCDNRYEFGLNLGLWRREKESSNMEAPKPIYWVFKQIDQIDEKGVYGWQRY